MTEKIIQTEFGDEIVKRDDSLFLRYSSEKISGNIYEHEISVEEAHQAMGSQYYARDVKRLAYEKSCFWYMWKLIDGLICLVKDAVDGEFDTARCHIDYNFKIRKVESRLSWDINGQSMDGTIRRPSNHGPPVEDIIHDLYLAMQFGIRGSWHGLTLTINSEGDATTKFRYKRGIRPNDFLNKAESSIAKNFQQESSAPSFIRKNRQRQIIRIHYGTDIIRMGDSIFLGFETGGIIGQLRENEISVEEARLAMLHWRYERNIMERSEIRKKFQDMWQKIERLACWMKGSINGKFDTATCHIDFDFHTARQEVRSQLSYKIGELLNSATLRRPNDDRRYSSMHSLIFFLFSDTMGATRGKWHGFTLTIDKEDSIVIKFKYGENHHPTKHVYADYFDEYYALIRDDVPPFPPTPRFSHENWPVTRQTISTEFGNEIVKQGDSVFLRSSDSKVDGETICEHEISAEEAILTMRHWRYAREIEHSVTMRKHFWDQWELIDRLTSLVRDCIDGQYDTVKCRIDYEFNGRDSKPSLSCEVDGLSRPEVQGALDEKMNIFSGILSELHHAMHFTIGGSWHGLTLAIDKEGATTTEFSYREGLQPGNHIGKNDRLEKNFKR